MSKQVCPACGWTGEYSDTEKQNVQGKWLKGYCPNGGTKVRSVKE